MATSEEPPVLKQALGSPAGLLALTVAGFAYAAISVRPQPPGLTRLLMSAPLFILFSVGPLQLKDKTVIGSGTYGFMVGWLANFKLLSYSAGRGPLSYPGLSASQWLLMLALPYFPAKRGHSAAQTHHVLLSIVCKLALCGGLTAFLLSPQGAAHPVLRHVCYALYIWLVASLMLDAPMPLGCRLLNHMALQPAMANPFGAATVREFWGRRYNQIVSSILQETVYLPIAEGSWLARPKAATVLVGNGTATAKHDGQHAGGQQSGHENGHAVVSGKGGAVAKRRGGGVANAKGGEDGRVSTGAQANAYVSVEAAGKGPAASSGAGAAAGGPMGVQGGRSWRRQLLGMCAAFVVSGLMHEVCILYMCGGRLEGSYRMLLFFLVQPLLILIQEAAHGLLLPAALQGSSSRVGYVLRVASTWALVLASAEFLFWGPFEACGIDTRGLKEAMGLFESLSNVLGIRHLSVA